MKRTFADAKVLFGDKLSFKTFLRWVRTLGEIIQWMISAIQEVPWLNQDTKGVCGYSQNREQDRSTFVWYCFVVLPPQGWLGFFQAKRWEKNSISYCVFDLVLMYFALFDTIHSPCSIRFGPLRFLIFRLRLKKFSELFYSQNSRVLETLLFQALFSRRKVSVYTWLILKYRKLL